MLHQIHEQRATSEQEASESNDCTIENGRSELPKIILFCRGLGAAGKLNTKSPSKNLTLCIEIYVALFIILNPYNLVRATQNKLTPILSDENFTFAYNGSFLQLDAGREWPFNSKREISFKFRTKSAHGLLIYQTFDHNKLVKEDDQESLDLVPITPAQQNNPSKTPTNHAPSSQRSPLRQEVVEASGTLINGRRRTRSTKQFERMQLNHVARTNRENQLLINTPLPSTTIAATASERLVNSLFSFSPAAAINGNNLESRAMMTAQMNNRHLPMQSNSGINSLIASKDDLQLGRILRGMMPASMKTEANNRVLHVNQVIAEPTVLSSATISSLSASLYELYLKLENGRLKIMYEYGSRLNQTYCGKGLNDDRWHRVDLKVDPELNQMVLILDQTITVEIVLSQQLLEDETNRRNELVFTNSVLYLGGLDNNASIVKNVKQRLYMAQFIGCIGQIMLKTDQHTESTLQPAPLDRLVMVKRGCVDMCDTDNYCLHGSACVNHYTHTRCDCFGTSYEDNYCWHDRLTTLSMHGYSTLVYRIYDWRDRHHSNANRLSLQFKTLALDSILFFAYGDLSAQQNQKNLLQGLIGPGTMIQPQISLNPTTINISSPMTIQRPLNHQNTPNNNYMAVSLSNGTIVVELSFGDQPILLSNALYEKIYNRSTNANTIEASPTSNLYRPLSLSDGRWHNVTIIHSSKQLSLLVDNFSVNYTILGKNNHLYFDPSIYIGSVPNLLLNETRYLVRPFNLRHKFVGCMRSVYFNHHDILLALKKSSSMVEYRDPLGKPHFDTCKVQETSSLPLTLRSGKSYLTFQLTPNSHTAMISKPRKSDDEYNDVGTNHKQVSDSRQLNLTLPMKKLTRIEFEYKTPLQSHFLAGGHLRDLSYHDLGGYWTLHAQEDCQLHVTISSGITFEPEQVIRIEPKNISCDPSSWFKISMSMISGDKVLNVTRSRASRSNKTEEETDRDLEEVEHQSCILKSSIELLHQVQLGGDLAKFGESSSVPFSGCMRKIKINGHLFDSRDFVSSSASVPPLATSLNQQNGSLLLVNPTQSDVISNRMAQGFVTLDSCGLINPCISQNPCKNNGTCKINESGEPECDCSKTGYLGKRCHFAMYKQSCQDLFLSGQRKSSYYLIDLDRNGPLKPIRVRCNMDEGGSHIETALSHNLPSEYLIRRSETKDTYLDITYLAFHHLFTGDGFYMHEDSDEVDRTEQDSMLRSLIGQSLYCRQYFKYECRSAPLDLGNKTWMEAPYPRNHKLTSLDGINRGKCMCATTEKKCLDPARSCNCDSGDPIWSDDSYDLIGHEDVGLTRIVLLKKDPIENSASKEWNNPESQSRLTLSDLKCYGTKRFESQHEITFKTSDAYIELPGWRRGDISFSFRTASSPPAIILYQLATSRNHGYFRLTLVSDTRLQFEFIVNRRPRKLFLVSTHKLNNGEWQQVFIEYDVVNLRLTVNDDSSMIDLDASDYLGTFEGPLFIGGAPSKYLVGDISKRNGFTGCFRGLIIDGRSIDLRDYLSPSMPTVIGGCKPSCTKNLCQNGGKCIEFWGSYECECSNPIAHSGNNCEINLNTNSITFVTRESYYVQVSNDSSLYPSYLIKNILLNIRTYQEIALILYASDHLNNFIQLHKNGSSLAFTFNSNTSIVSAQVPIDDESSPDNVAVILPANLEKNSSIGALNASSTAGNNSSSVSRYPELTSVDRSINTSNTSGSGQPIQVKIERHRLRTTFYVNNNFMVVDKPMIFLTNYTQNPWLNPELELVRPPRPRLGSKTYSQIFLANIDEYFTTRLPGFTGCIQGLSINNQLFDFNRAHLTGELKGDYRIGCKMHCDSFPCKNHGTCIENWKEDKIQCKCDTTSYVGSLCDEDVAAMFNGKTSYFLYHLIKKTYSSNDPLLTNKRGSSARSSSPIEQSVTDEALRNKVLNKNNQDWVTNFFEVSLAFSTDLNQSMRSLKNGIQVLVLVTFADSSKHFFLGLTNDGSLFIQEDYGNSMSLSRLIKKPDTPYNDGYRHIVKYSRLNQTIQIMVDYQTYLPTMSVITGSHVNMNARRSVVMVGTAGEKATISNPADSSSDTEYSNYSGCISNLVMKLDDLTIEPLSEAFGQDLETVNINSTKETDTSTKSDEASTKKPLLGNLQLHPEAEIKSGEELPKVKSATLSIINKLSGMEVNEDIETIIARDVEQGKCATFKKPGAVNEKRSVNEPKLVALLEPRPVYMDPPIMKLYTRKQVATIESPKISVTLFYCSAFVLALVSSTTLIYVYILQLRYKSEKFRCETPFFHRRDEVPDETIC